MSQANVTGAVPTPQKCPTCGTYFIGPHYCPGHYLIRSGMCPNGCGLMGPYPDPLNKGWKGQECGKCGFSTNQMPEPGEPQ